MMAYSLIIDPKYRQGYVNHLREVLWYSQLYKVTRWISQALKIALTSPPAPRAPTHTHTVHIASRTPSLIQKLFDVCCLSCREVI